MEHKRQARFMIQWDEEGEFHLFKHKDLSRLLPIYLKISNIFVIKLKTGKTFSNKSHDVKKHKKGIVKEQTAHTKASLRSGCGCN